jgi:hypothetical protein
LEQEILEDNGEDAITRIVDYETVGRSFKFIPEKKDKLS